MSGKNKNGREKSRPFAAIQKYPRLFTPRR
jgi:hypothetical protein